jgi:hypothetical protein
LRIDEVNAALSPPDFGVVHRREVVEDERGCVCQFHPASAWQRYVEGILTKDPARRDGHDGAPPVAAAKDRVARSIADLRRRIAIKRRGEKIFDRTADTRLLGGEVAQFSHDLPPKPQPVHGGATAETVQSTQRQNGLFFSDRSAFFIVSTLRSALSTFCSLAG